MDFAMKNLTAGQLNAIVKNLGGKDGALRFLRGELIVSEVARKWREEDGVIYFSVTSDGTTGPKWTTRLVEKGFCLSDGAKQILQSPNFKQTKGVTTEIAVLKGSLWNESNRNTKNIRAKAQKRKLLPPNAEVACLIREKFTNKELEAMGLVWVAIMHEPIKESDDDSGLLGVDRSDDSSALGASWGKPLGTWYACDGFAFALPQVSA